MAGCITASKFKAAIHTDYTQPFCFPSKRTSGSQPKVPSGVGMKKKKVQGKYFHKAELNHINLTLTDRGLVVYPQYPYLDAN